MAVMTENQLGSHSSNVTDNSITDKRLMRKRQVTPRFEQIYNYGSANNNDKNDEDYPEFGRRNKKQPLNKRLEKVVSKK
jgi:hypothetical protein